MIYLKNEKGSVLIITLTFMLIFIMLGLAAIHTAGTNNEWANKQRMSDEAFWVAEAGIEKARAKIKQNEFSSFSACGLDKCLTENVIVNGVSQGEYLVKVNSGSSVITSTGGFPNLLATNAQQRKIRVSSSPFAFTLFGDTNVCFGFKQGGGCHVIGTGTIVEGEVGTNGSTLDPGTATINGNAIPGAAVNLSVIEAPADFNATNAGQAGPAPASITSSGDYTYDSISGSITITGNVRMHLTNTVNSINLGNNTNIILTAGSSLIIYAEGGINADANNIDLNNANSPQAENFIFYSTGTSPVVIKNNSNVYMAVYAPNAEIEVSKNNGTTTGSFIGKTVYLKNNNTISYDEDLINVSVTSGAGKTFIVRFWQEIDPNS